jgi:hypothetical protein
MGEGMEKFVVEAMLGYVGNDEKWFKFNQIIISNNSQMQKIYY